MDQSKRKHPAPTICLLSFPNEVLVHILESLDPSDVLSVMETCKTLYAVACWMHGYWVGHTGGNPGLDLAIANSQWSGLCGHLLFVQLRNAELFGPTPWAISRKFYRSRLVELMNPNAPITVFVVNLLRVCVVTIHDDTPLELTRVTTEQTESLETPKCCTEDIGTVTVTLNYAHKVRDHFGCKWLLRLYHRCTEYSNAPGITTELMLMRSNDDDRPPAATARHGELWDTLRMFASMEAQCPRHAVASRGKSCTNACYHPSNEDEYKRLLEKHVKSEHPLT